MSALHLNPDDRANGHGGGGGDRGAKLTVVHVTHEAVDHIGGIGTVLDGMIGSPVYQKAVGRTIMVGPLFYPDRRPKDPKHRLGEHALRCLYSGPDEHDPDGFGAILRPIEWAFGVRIVYGVRRFGAADRTGDAEVLLVDVTNPDATRLGALKWALWQHFGVDSRRYEQSWDFEEYCRLADPAYHALCALRAGQGGPPAVVISHEYMGMCTALRCAMDRARFRTVFHGHECTTARRIVEHLPGHDVAFYPAMRAAMEQGRFAEEVFGDQSDFARHALVSRTHQLDAVLAVGPETAEELQFLSAKMKTANIHVAYNGVPAVKLSMADKAASRARVMSWLSRVIGFTPDYLFTHVTRPVVSKGLWRDQKIGKHIEKHLNAAGKTGVYLLLTCGAEPRSFEQASAMFREYAWPAQHREGYPDLSGPEVGIHRAMTHFNQYAHQGGGSGGTRPCLQAVLVNQWGFTRETLGEAAPEGLSLADLRRAADCELGMSIYEPFGIAHLEALHAGAICIPSTVCGCLGLVRRGMAELGIDEKACPNVLAADFIHESLGDPVHLSAHERDQREDKICAALADELWRRLPKTDADRARLLDTGQRLASRMGWDVVCETDILPVLRDVVQRDGARRPAGARTQVAG